MTQQQHSSGSKTLIFLSARSCRTLRKKQQPNLGVSHHQREKKRWRDVSMWRRSYDLQLCYHMSANVPAGSIAPAHSSAAQHLLVCNNNFICGCKYVTARPQTARGERRDTFHPLGWTCRKKDSIVVASSWPLTLWRDADHGGGLLTLIPVPRTWAEPSDPPTPPCDDVTAGLSARGHAFFFQHLQMNVLSCMSLFTSKHQNLASVSHSSVSGTRWGGARA